MSGTLRPLGLRAFEAAGLEEDAVRDPYITPFFLLRGYKQGNQTQQPEYPETPQPQTLKRHY